MEGNGFCFSCSKFVPNKEEDAISTVAHKAERVQRDAVEGVFDYYPHRGISRVTMEHYGVQAKFVDEHPIEVGFIYPNKSAKIRLLAEKKFWSKGPMREASLFGLDKFDPGSKKSITITEGEYDALAVFEMTRGNTAAVSIKSASSAKGDCIRDRDYINSFDRILLCFDNDEPGQKATREVASLFDFNKVYQVKFHKHKDANEYLEKGDMSDFMECWKHARRFAPDNIISSFSEIQKSLEDSKEDQIGTYPFRNLNTALYGLHQGEVIVFKGPEGIGKTEVFRAIEHHLLATTSHNIGIIHLEEDNGTTVKAISGYELRAPAVLPDCGISAQDIFQGYKKAVKDNEARVHIYSSFETEDEHVLPDNIRFLVAAAGCKFIFLDHISWLGTGLQEEDERKKLDRLSQKFKLLAKELKFCLCMISHVNDEGKTRGSRNITKVANTVIDLSRDVVSIDSINRNTTSFLIEKARLGGHTGPAGRAIFDSMTGRLEDEDYIS
jgi:twinkle protein